MKIQISKAGSMKTVVDHIVGDLEDLLNNNNGAPIEKSVLEYARYASAEELRADMKNVFARTILETILPDFDHESLAELGWQDSEIKKLERLGLA